MSEHDFALIASLPSGDGISHTRIYWCRNTGALRSETKSDGRYRAGGGPVVSTPANAAHIEAQAAEIARWQALNGRNVEEYGQRLVEATARANSAEADAARYRYYRSRYTEHDEFGPGMTEAEVDALMDKAMAAADAMRGGAE